MLVDLTLPSGRIARREVPIDILDLPATRSTAGKRRPAPGEEPRGVAPRTRELPRGTISGEEGASSSVAARSDGEASEASDAEGGDEAGGSVTEPPAARSSSDRGRAPSAASVARTRRDEAVFEAYAKLASEAAQGRAVQFDKKDKEAMVKAHGVSLRQIEYSITAARKRWAEERGAVCAPSRSIAGRRRARTPRGPRSRSLDGSRWLRASARGWGSSTARERARVARTTSSACTT